MSGGGHGFLGVPQVALDDADVAILSAPFEATVVYGKGTSTGPGAILEASTHLETMDEELGFDLAEHLSFCTLPPVVEHPEERVEAYLKRLERVCAGYGLSPPFPLALGGEHSVTSSILAGVRPAVDQLTVVQIDAHADLRDSYHGSSNNHACAMRRVLDRGVPRLIAIGIRSCSPEEFEFAASDERISTWYAHRLGRSGGFEELLNELRGLGGPVYLTIDVDGLELSLSPGTGTPYPGGLSWHEAMAILRALLLQGDGELVGADICETVPQTDSRVNEMVAAKLAFKILSYNFFRSKTGREAPVM